MGTGNGCSFIEDRQFLTVPLNASCDLLFQSGVKFNAIKLVIKTGIKSTSPLRSKA